MITIFEAVTHTTKIDSTEAATRTNQPIKPTVEVEHVEKSEKRQENQQKENLQEITEKPKKQTISQEFLDDLEREIELIHNIKIQFSVHKSTGRTMVKVINKDNEQTIREVPSERILNLAAKLDEMIGMRCDKTV